VLMYLRRRGPGLVTAADIAGPVGVQVHNPGLHVAALNNTGELEMELTVERGRGYVSAAQNKQPGHGAGRIPVDSIYSPVMRVIYRVEATRVEQRTDFDKLILDVETKCLFHNLSRAGQVAGREGDHGPRCVGHWEGRALASQQSQPRTATGPGCSDAAFGGMMVTATLGTRVTAPAILSAVRPCSSLPSCGEKLRPGKITVTCAPGSSASRRTRSAAHRVSLRPGQSTSSSGTPRSGGQAA